MNWGRAKTILIILFLLIDMLLLGFLFVVKNGVNYIKEETARDTATVLNEHNIKVETEQIPLKRVDKKILYFENLACTPELAAELFFGKNYSVSGGNDCKVYTSLTESVTIEKSTILYENNRKIIPCKSFDEIKKAVLSDLKRFGFNEDEVILKNNDIKNGVCSVQLIQRYDGITVNGTEMNVVADSSGIIKMHGRWFDLKSVENTYEKLPDITSILINMIYNPDYNGLKINDIKAVYYIPLQYIDGAEVCAYPVYEVTGDNNKQYILEEYE
ncbi:MAG: hypothetical protein E7407_02800 [Ruminococcaceae bacterium]|nr:hypothetical protein [Oscillospiraceae bacterium]